MHATTRVLVVGLGSIGQRHARLLSERDDVDLHICDAVDEHRAQAVAGLSRPAAGEHAGYSAALAAHPDIVFLCTPNHLHVPMGLQAIAAGVDVFVEKPISDDLEEARKLVHEAESAGRFLQVGYMLRLDEGLRKMKEVVDSGGVGNLIGGRAMIGTYVTLLNAKSPDRDKRPNSLIVDYTHELDFIRWFFGDVQNVAAMSARLGDLEMKPPPNIFQMILKMQSGALVQVHLDYVQFPQRRILEVIGDRGTLEYDFMTGKIKYFVHGREHEWTDLDVAPIMERWDDLFRLEHHSLLAARRDGCAPLVTGADGLAALEVAQAAIDAAEG